MVLPTHREEGAKLAKNKKRGGGDSPERQAKVALIRGNFIAEGLRESTKKKEVGLKSDEKEDPSPADKISCIASKGNPRPARKIKVTALGNDHTHYHMKKNQSHEKKVRAGVKKPRTTASARRERRSQVTAATHPHSRGKNPQ